MEEQLVTFNLGTEEFGVDIMKVQEIIRIPAITRVPKAPAYIEGVINLRGNIIPVVDLRTRFHMPANADTDLSRIVVLQMEKRVFGVRVDAVNEVLRLSEENIEPPPPIAVGMEEHFIRNVGKVGDRILILINTDQIMDEEFADEIAV
ncbi:MAG: chemotaxis protein CheW [Peptococcaceae bacterium]|jgi:purine-binding chemotaxis protein CheW|nr:chemotaxis protein CheW [Peptococcaceae bacterium]